MSGRPTLLAVLATLLLWAALLALGATARKPVYVGARVCGTCHSGKGMGNQFSLWLYSKHSRAWAVLARPEAKQIAAISGLRQEPQEAAICLGCHAPAGQAEPWEKDDTFHLEDGVQCEACHGPGSEYSDDEIMRNHETARAAGLKMPAQDDCMRCHIEKGSHVAVVKLPQLDLAKAIRTIAHPSPLPAVKGSVPDIDGPDAKTKPGPKYVGSAACGTCHRAASRGYQFSVWRRSPHALAFAALGTPKAEEMARKAGIDGDPQREPRCLKCHTTGYGGAHLESFSTDEGVGCEACHGAGSEYTAEAIMRDRPAARGAGLNPEPRQTCAVCHQNAHGSSFDPEQALLAIAHPTKLPEAAQIPRLRYKTPINLAFRPDGKELYVACEGSDSVIVVDPAKKVKIAEIPVGGQPHDVAFTPDGRLAFASNQYDDSVSVIDVAARKAVKTLEVGDGPHGLLTDAQGRLLYVLNTASDDISVFDVATLERVRNLSAGRKPWSLALAPDDSTILVTNSLSRIPGARVPLVSEITQIGTQRGSVADRPLVPDANMMMGIAWHPSGEFALAALNRTKNLVPMTRLLQGWTITNGLGVVWRDGSVDQVLLDEPNLGFSDPTDVAFTPDGRFALVTSAGTDRVAVVDVEKLLGIVRGASKYDREHVLPNHLGKPTEFVAKHISTLNAPRGIAVARDGRTAYVANSLDDSLTVIDLQRMEAAGRIDLGGPKEISKTRFGERLFNSANITFRKQFACASCHPDGHIDGLAYDIEADGIGVNPVENRTLRGILDTAPFKWEGTNPSLSRQCGARLSVYFTRLLPFTPEQLSALDNYITTIERPPNRFRALGAPLNLAQRRGKEVFERTTTNDGREIPPLGQCVVCHNPPYYTDRKVHDVGTKQPLDRQGKYDVPHLNNIYDRAPYLHGGMAATLEEIWTVYNLEDRHGITNDMTKDQLNDLIEYLKTL